MCSIRPVEINSYNSICGIARSNYFHKLISYPFFADFPNKSAFAYDRLQCFLFNRKSKFRGKSESLSSFSRRLRQNVFLGSPTALITPFSKSASPSTKSINSHFPVCHSNRPTATITVKSLLTTSSSRVFPQLHYPVVESQSTPFPTDRW